MDAGNEGIYCVWSPDRKLAYVGESANLAQRRKQHNSVAGRLGCVFEIVFLTTTTRSIRQRLEEQVSTDLADRGVCVVSTTIREAGRKGGIIGGAAAKAKRTVPSR